MFNSTTHTERIVVFALQQWLRERSTMFRYKYVASLVWGYFKGTVCPSQIPQNVNYHKIYILDACDSVDMHMLRSIWNEFYSRLYVFRIIYKATTEILFEKTRVNFDYVLQFLFFVKLSF